MGWERLTKLVSEGQAVAASVLVAGWNMVADGSLNNAAALLVALVTTLVMVQKAALNCRRWRRESAARDGRNAGESGGGGI